MYEDYFGLERPPFKITPDTSLFYEGGKRGDILAALVYAIHRGEGIIKVVGEVGSGKTMLCRMLQLKLPDTVEIVYIANPSVSPQDILFVIAHELSLPVTRDASKHEVMHLLQDYLLQRHMENKQVVLFIEEAQGMPLDTLEEIRLLSNLETDQNKLLQIVLFGQPELDQNLAQQSIRQLRERITHSFDLDPLTQDEIHNYLNFRMREVGYTGPELINKTIAKKVEQYSGGLLRRINIIADKILLSAFAEGTHNLTPKHVTAAVNDSAFDAEVETRSKAHWWLVPLLLAALAWGLYASQERWLPLQISKWLPTQENAQQTVKPVTEIAAVAVDTQVDKLLASTDIAAADLFSEESAPVEAEPVEKLEVNEVQPSSTLLDQVEQLEEQIAAIEQQALPLQASVAAAQVDEDKTLQKALDQAAASDTLAAETSADLSLSADYNLWLDAKLRESRDWLSQADQDNVSIQVLMRSKSAARELVQYLRNEWPLDLSKTYLYEVNIENRSIYRVFYSEFDSMSKGRYQLEQLPESVKVNSPYLHSVHRMQKTLL